MCFMATERHTTALRRAMRRSGPRRLFFKVVSETKNSPTSWNVNSRNEVGPYEKGRIVLARTKEGKVVNPRTRRPILAKRPREMTAGIYVYRRFGRRSEEREVGTRSSSSVAGAERSARTRAPPNTRSRR